MELEMPSGEGGHHVTIPPAAIPVTALSFTTRAMSGLLWECSPCRQDPSLPSKPLRELQGQNIGKKREVKGLFLL